MRLDRAAARCIPVIFVSMLGVLGCHHSEGGTRSPMPLQSLVGRHVHLEGQFGGPGKIADFILVPGGEIYLMGSLDAGGQPLRYGNRIAVDGVLGYQVYPPTTLPEDSHGPTPQRPFDHYYIRDAKVHVLP